MTTKLTRVIAVTGGKGGVGKSNVALNLGVSLAKRQQKVLLLDADLGLANLDVLLGIRSHKTLEHVLAGECDLRDVLVTGPAGIHIIPASSGVQKLVDISPMEQAGIVRAFDDLEGQFEYLIVDTAAGISESVMNFVNAAQDILLVVCNEPTSLTDAYAFIKVMNSQHSVTRFHIVANMVKNEKEANQLFRKLENAANQFMDIALDLQGYIPYDEDLKRAVKEQRAVCDKSPASLAAVAFGKLANSILDWPSPRSTEGRLEFFVNQLIASGY